jgi:signal transduction histidine kinase/CheY-like chemotaxis protein
MDYQKKIKELENEIARLRSVTNQYNIIQNLLDDANKKRISTEKKLKSALKKADESSKAKSIFLATMSHEIRTPLNGIIGVIEILQNTTLTDEQKEYLNIITVSSESLLKIINDILDYTKIESGKTELEKIDINIDDIISNVVNILVTNTYKKGLELITYVDTDIPPCLSGDPVRIQQIILNFANNAIKFTSEGEVYISVKKGKVTKNKVELKIKVKDTGIGISKENQTKLFHSFSQADTSTTRKYGGTGLGLAIAKRLIKNMNGSIKIKSSVGEGTTFNFNIVLNRCTEVKENKIEKNKDEKINILIVDDNKTESSVIKYYLDTANYNSTVLNNPMETENMLKDSLKANTPFNIVLLDFKMPGIDGITLAKQLKVNPDFKNIKFVLLFSLTVKESITKNISELFDATLAKPVNFKRLTEVVKNITSKSVTKEEQKQTDEIVDEKFDIKVLVVDDNVFNLKIANAIISMFVKHIDTAVNGKEAIEKHKINKYDIIFMDMFMPKMDGLEATKIIRQNNEDNVIIIAMTANVMKEDIDDCIENGMNDYILKPYKANDIRKLIDKWTPTK